MENNSKGIFYAIVAVATIIIGVAGATFAYYTASANNSVIAGTAATAGLSLTASLSTQTSGATGNMVPQLSTAIGSAVKAGCVDSNGNTVCKVYTITVKNTGTSKAVVNGTIKIEKSGSSSTFSNLKWALVTDLTSGTVGTINAVPTTAAAQSLASNVSLATNGTATYNVVVFINETSTDQTSTDKGSFTGTITFSAANGSGVTSTIVS